MSTRSILFQHSFVHHSTTPYQSFISIYPAVYTALRRYAPCPNLERSAFDVHLTSARCYQLDSNTRTSADSVDRASHSKRLFYHYEAICHSRCPLRSYSGVYICDHADAAPLIDLFKSQFHVKSRAKYLVISGKAESIRFSQIFFF